MARSILAETVNITRHLPSNSVATKKNPLKLNKLQLRTLALAQVIARDPNSSKMDDISGNVELLAIPRPHGDHVHVGQFVVSAVEASGFSNPAVWLALSRKGLVSHQNALTITLTAQGIAYDTGLADRFLTESDH